LRGVGGLRHTETCRRKREKEKEGRDIRTYLGEGGGVEPLLEETDEGAARDLFQALPEVARLHHLLHVPGKIKRGSEKRREK
jgi:hypothetical protein